MERKDKTLPAIAGGSPAKKKPYKTQKRYGKDELEKLRQALEQNTLFYTSGKMVKEMEGEMSEMHGVKYAIGSSSGTAAIHTALIAGEISPGDEVITTPITDMGTLSPILYQGAVPVFADVEPHSYELSPASVEKCITSNTRAVIAVHLWGNSCDMRALKKICTKHKILLIEDCAQAWGCTYRGRSVGTIGEMGCFSLNEYKHIACGDGGITITDNKVLAEKIRLASDKCYNRKAGAGASRNPVFLANNYRMTELQAAVTLAQFKKLEGIVVKRRKLAEELNSRLSSIEGISLPRSTKGCNPSWWFYMMRIDPVILGVTARDFALALNKEGIGAGAGYIGQCTYEYPVFSKHSAFARGSHPYINTRYGRGLCSTAEEVLDTSVTLPINEAFTVSDMRETVEGLKRLVAWLTGKMNTC